MTQLVNEERRLGEVLASVGPLEAHYVAARPSHTRTAEHHQAVLQPNAREVHRRPVESPGVLEPGVDGAHGNGEFASIGPECGGHGEGATGRESSREAGSPACGGLAAARPLDIPFGVTRLDLHMERDGVAGEHRLAARRAMHASHRRTWGASWREAAMVVLIDSSAVRRSPPMRRLVTGIPAAAAFGLIAFAGAAYAQAPPEITPNFAVTPSKTVTPWIYQMAVGAVILGSLVLVAVLVSYIRFSPKFFGKEAVPKPAAPGARPPMILRPPVTRQAPGPAPARSPAPAAAAPAPAATATA